MNTYLSFASIAKLHNNNPESASPIGELSAKGRSYAKDPGRFSLDVDVPSATQLINFRTTQDGVEIKMPEAIAEVEIGIANWLYEEALKGNITDSRLNTRDLLIERFTNNIIITDVGEMATNNVIWLPSFVTGFHIEDGVQNPFYMWMADAYFLIQYPDVQFTNIHPLPLAEMDFLMNANYDQIGKRLALQTPLVVSKREKTATDGFNWPYTERNILEFDILDLVNTGHFNVGSWVILHWGNDIDAEDRLFEQLQKEILDNSQFLRPRWEEKIPDLFNPLEWYVIPRFDYQGVLDLTNSASTYAPIVDHETERRIVNAYLAPSMPEDHIIKSLQTVPFLYKSIQANFVAKTNNRAGKLKIGNMFPDFQLISSLDPDFGLMNDETMAFIKGMEELIAAAEVVTPISLLPGGVTRLERLGKVCVAKRIGKIRYVMFTRWQMIEDGLVEE